MRKALAVLGVAALFMGGVGCNAVANIPDQQLWDSIQSGTQTAVSGALDLVIENKPELQPQIQKDCAIAAQVIEAGPMKLFSGANTNAILASGVTTALNDLSGKISPTIVASIQLGMNILLASVPLPNPTDPISPRLKGAVLALFTGSDNALQQIQKAPPVAPVAVTPAGPTARMASRVLVWPSQKK